MIRFENYIVMISGSKGDIRSAFDKMNEMFRTTEIKVNNTKRRYLSKLEIKKKKVMYA